MAVILALLGVASAAPRPAAAYDIVVASAIGDRSITSVAVTEVVADGDVATFTTARTQGTWEEAGTTLSYDSDAPSDADPWFLHMQHVVANVPARVALDETGAPENLVDRDGWVRAARERIYAEDVPVGALTMAEQLVDPEGLVRDLRRDFPGEPQPSWSRARRVAGLEATGTESCVREREGKRRTWTCEGSVQGPTDGSARLHEVRTRTVVTLDRRGLVRCESTISGTVVVLGPDGASAVDRPIAEQRLVERR